MYTEIRLDQGTPEWHAFRAMHIGASDAPIIMGVSPWRTPKQLYQEKLGLQKSVVTTAMQRGTDLEDPARACIKVRCGISLRPIVIESSINPWMSASLDGISLEGEVHEIKSPGKKDIELAKQGIVPKYYYPQIQHQIYCAETTYAIYDVYEVTGDFATGMQENLYSIRVERDDAYIADMIAKEWKFFQDYMNFIAPESDEEEPYEDATDPLWAYISLRIKDETECKKALKKMLDEKDKKIEEYKEALVKLADGRNMKGEGVYLKKSHRIGLVDYSKIPQLKDVDLDKYRKEGTFTWKIDFDLKDC